MSDTNHPFNRPEFTLQKKQSKKPLIISIVIAIIFLLAVTAGAAYYYRDQLFGNKQVDSTKKTEAQRGNVDEKALAETTSAASVYIARGDPEAATQVIDDAIRKTNSTAHKSALYQNKAMLIAGTDTPSAIEAIEESVRLNETFENTAYLAELYEREGNKDKAIEYYEKAIELYGELENTETDGGPTNVSLYQERVDRLRGQ